MCVCVCVCVCGGGVCVCASKTIVATSPIINAHYILTCSVNYRLQSSVSVSHVCVTSRETTVVPLVTRSPLPVSSWPEEAMYMCGWWIMCMRLEKMCPFLKNNSTVVTSF